MMKTRLKIYCGVILLLSCTIPAFFIKKGCWLQHRAHTLALWIMFIMTVPQFADRLAPVPTTHNPTAFFIVSLLALVVNAAAVIYQFSVIRRNKRKPRKRLNKRRKRESLPLWPMLTKL